MFVLWNGIILGSVDAEALLRLNPNVDSVSIDPVDIIRRGSSESTASTSYLLSTTLSVFSLGAIATSFIGFIVGLQDVYRDLLPSRSRRDPFILLLVIVPPLLIALVDPTVFLSALDASATFGVTFLFLILPAAIVWRQ
eukprot:gene10151-13035_t